MKSKLVDSRIKSAIEGPMKGDIIHHLTGQTVVAVPGVNTLTQLEMVLIELMNLGVKHGLDDYVWECMINELLSA